MQQGGSQYGMSPEMTPFSTSTTTAAASATTTRTHMLSSDHLQQHHKSSAGDASGVVVAEPTAASPISSRPPPPQPRSSGNFEELVPVSGSGGFGDDDGLGGEETDRGVAGGNRWPRQETLALLKIRSEMDAAFRDATLKGPLWEDVSRKLAEQGYIRSAKKCKEKFENVHKYYKRTKEGRAGRQDGKSYRFFSQLEALHTASSNTTAAAPPVNLSATPVSIGISMPRMQQTPPPDLPTTTTAPTPAPIGIPRVAPPDLTSAGISFSSNSSSSSSDSEDDLEGGGGGGGPSNSGRKRKRGSGGEGSSSSRKMMELFEGLMKQVMEKQEAMQQRFLEAIEKREQDRMIREEAWKRQEMARLTREHDLMAQERAISASRDAAIIAFLQKITGQTIQLPPAVVIPAAPPPQSTATPPPQQQQQQQQPHPPQHIPHHHHPPPSSSAEITRLINQNPSTEIVVAAVPEQQHPPPQEMVMGGGSSGGGFDPTSSRWPKAEVLALIKLRSGLESKYQEAGPKGPLWEEISAGMQRMGYNRSSKRCKEKWENINKYFKKVKESNKKRPEDAKTCPYFHQLDALYRKKMMMGGGGSSSSGFGGQNKQDLQQMPETTAAMDTNPNLQAAIMAPVIPPPPQGAEAESKKSDSKNGGNMEVQTAGNEGELFEEGSSGGRSAAKKPEDIMKELMVEQGRLQSVVMEDYHAHQEGDSDKNNIDDQEDQEDLEEDEEEEEEEDGEETEEEERKMGYDIQFQRPNAATGSSNGGGNAASAAPNSFLAMVQ